MATATHPEPTFRKVIDLDATEQEYLNQLAQSENVSEQDILHRSLMSYGSSRLTFDLDEAAVRELLTQVDQALDHAIESLRSANLEVSATNQKIREMRESVQ